MNIDKTMLRRLMDKYIGESNHPDMIRYGANFLRHFDGNLRAMQSFMALGRMHGGRVLDIGSGFGWHAVCFSLLGAAEVVANDMRDMMISTMEQRLTALRAEGVQVRVRSLLGDICSTPTPQHPFDAVFCNQTMEHVHDADGMFSAMARLLRRGGIAIIVNDNNALCKQIVRDNTAMWAQRDRSWECIEQLKKERPIENALIEPFAITREREVRSVMPDISNEQLAKLVGATAGMIEPQIRKAVAEFVATGALPTPPEHSWCRDPVSGEYCERLLDPYQLTKSLRTHGFRARVRHGFGRFPATLLNGVRFRPLNASLFQLKPVFAIVAERT